MRASGRLPLALLLVAFVALAGAYGVVIPVLEGPDEPQHLFLAQHLARARALPVQSLDDAVRGPWEQEGSQPPLYYALATPLVWLAGSNLTPDGLWYNHLNTMGQPALVGNENRFIHPAARENWPWTGYALAVHLGRALSTLFGAITVALVASIAGRAIGPPGTRPWLVWAAAAVVALNPQFLATSATFSNDALTIMLCTTALALTLRVVDGHDDTVTVAALCLAAALAPLAKVSGLLVAVFVSATLLYVAWRRGDGRLVRRVFLPMVATVAVVAGWWYVRNLALYGDPTGLSHMLPPALRRDVTPERWLRGLPAELRGLWFSAWGIFGWFTVMLPLTLYGVLSVVALAGAGGAVLALWRRVDWLRAPRLLWLAAWAVVVLVALLRWTTYAKGAHGRLLFPAVAFLAVTLVVGWRALLPAWLPDRALGLALGAGMAALATYALLGVIRPAYAQAPSLAYERVPASARPIDAIFHGSLKLIAADLPDRVEEGRWFPVTLYWQALDPIERDAYVAVRVDQPQRPTESFHADYPWAMASGKAQLAYLAGGNTPPSLLQPGTVYADRRYVLAPSSVLAERERLHPSSGTVAAQPVEARFSVHMFDPSGQTWPVAVDGAPPTEGDWSAALILDPARRVTGSERAAPMARFGDCIDLVRVEVSGPEQLLAQWAARCPVSEDLTAFVHLVRADGVPLGVFDRPPATEAPYPTSAWRPGDRVESRFPIGVPKDMWASDSNLLVGLYRSDGSRLPAYRADGSRWPDDAAVIQEAGGPR